MELTLPARQQNADPPAGDEDAEILRDLVGRAARRDADAFAALIRRFERVALSVGYGALHDADRAGDVVQEAFVRAWERIGELKDPARFGAWVCGMVRNLAIDERRKDRVRAIAHGPDGVVTEMSGANAAAARMEADPAEAVDRQEQRERVTSALDQLDPVSRQAVVLRYYEGLSSKEIGQLLELAPAAVDMRLSRARQQLRKTLSATQMFASDAAD